MLARAELLAIVGHLNKLEKILTDAWDGHELDLSTDQHELEELADLSASIDAEVAQMDATA